LANACMETMAMAVWLMGSCPVTGSILCHSNCGLSGCHCAPNLGVHRQVAAAAVAAAAAAAAAAGWVGRYVRGCVRGCVGGGPQ
jgi:hypothetical protein